MDNQGQTPQDVSDFYQPSIPQTGTGELTPPPEQEAISWTAAEYIEHTKDPVWYLGAVAATTVLAGLGYLLSRDRFTPIAVGAFGLLLIAVSNRKPRVLDYMVDEKGITIAGKHYVFNDFQSFSIIREDQIESIMLVPQKRWSSTVSLYFAPDDGQKIFDVLSNFLPFEDREKDLIDKFLHKIRF